MGVATEGGGTVRSIYIIELHGMMLIESDL